MNVQTKKTSDGIIVLVDGKSAIITNQMVSDLTCVEKGLTTKIIESIILGCQNSIIGLTESDGLRHWTHISERSIKALFIMLLDSQESLQHKHFWLCCIGRIMGILPPYSGVFEIEYISRSSVFIQDFGKSILIKVNNNSDIEYAFYNGSS